MTMPATKEQCIEAIESLEQLIDINAFQRLADKSFAVSLKDQFRKKGTLSEKQWIWVDKLTQKAIMPEQAEDKPTTNIGNLSGLVALMDTAKANQKSLPKLTLKVGEQKVKLSVASQHSKYNGGIHVTDGGPYGNNVWFGAVYPTGEFKMNPKVEDEQLDTVTALLKKLSEDPHKTVSELGKLSGNCVFCNKELSDPKSLKVGYGETCSKTWGLHSQWKAALKEATYTPAN